VFLESNKPGNFTTSLSLNVPSKRNFYP